MSGQTLTVISEQVTTIIYNQIAIKIANKALYPWFMVHGSWVISLQISALSDLSAGAQCELRPRGLQQVVDHHWGARQAAVQFAGAMGFSSFFGG